jgi:hypothetical protein
LKRQKPVSRVIEQLGAAADKELVKMNGQTLEQQQKKFDGQLKQLQQRQSSLATVLQHAQQLEKTQMGQLSGLILDTEHRCGSLEMSLQAHQTVLFEMNHSCQALGTKLDEHMAELHAMQQVQQRLVQDWATSTHTPQQQHTTAVQRSRRRTASPSCLSRSSAAERNRFDVM